jgi:predicted HTH domain antitoxin
MPTSNVVLEIQCPELVYQALRAEGFDKTLLQKEAQTSVAVRLFADGRLSLGKASEFAGVSIVSFMDILRRFNVPVTVYDEEEFARDLETLQTLLKPSHDERASEAIR